MSLKRFVAISATLLCSLAWTAQAQVNPNVQNVTTGITTDEALKLIGPGFQVSRPTGGDPNMTLTFAGKPRELWALVTIKGKVAYISHSVGFAQGAEPNYADTTSRILSKYGQSFSPQQFAWDEQLKPITDAYHGSVCTKALAYLQSVDTGIPSSDRANVPNGRDLSKSCSYVVRAELGRSGPNASLVGGMTIQLMDMRAYYALALQQQHQQESQNQQKVDKSKTIKPPL